jgi:hypothetical protein
MALMATDLAAFDRAFSVYFEVHRLWHVHVGTEPFHGGMSLGLPIDLIAYTNILFTSKDLFIFFDE